VVLLTINALAAAGRGSEARRIVQQAGADQDGVAALAELDVDACWRCGKYGLC
jgi:hypothetical protein